MKRTPRCSRCLQEHYNFEDCNPAMLAEVEQARVDAHAEYRVRAHQARNANRFGATTLVRQPRRDGLTDWRGDKLESFAERRGPVFRQQRPPLATGAVKGPDGENLTVEPLVRHRPSVTYPGA